MHEVSEFDECWERVRKITGWDKYSELASFLKISGSSVSGTKKRGNFPIEWAYKLATHYGGSTDWIMQERGPQWLSGEKAENEDGNQRKACDCMLFDGTINRSKLLTLGAENPPNFELLNHIFSKVGELKNIYPEPQPNDFPDILMIIYSFCQPENRVAAEIICSVTLSWLSLTSTGEH